MVLHKLSLFVGTNFLWPVRTIRWTLVLYADPQLMTPRSQPRLPTRSRKWRTSVIPFSMTPLALINNHVLYPKILNLIPLLLLLLPFLLSCLQCLSNLSRTSFLYPGAVLSNRLLHPLLRRRCVIVHAVVLAKPLLFPMQSHPKNAATSRAKSNYSCWKPRWRWKVWGQWGHLYSARNVTETWFSFEVIKVIHFPVLMMLISPFHLDDPQPKKSWTLLIIYFLVALWTCFVQTPLCLIPSNMRRAFYAYMAPFSLPSTFDVGFCSWLGPYFHISLPWPLLFCFFLLFFYLRLTLLYAFRSYLWLDVAVHGSICITSRQL